MDYECGRYDFPQRKSEGCFQKKWEWMLSRQKYPFLLNGQQSFEGLNEIVLSTVFSTKQAE